VLAARLFPPDVLGVNLLVLARLDAGAAAAYAVVWTITQSLYLVSSGMSQSMVAHSATDPDGLDSARRAMVRRALVLVAPASVVIAVGAPLILSLFGRHYADYGSDALRWAALSAIPNVITASTVGAARVRRRIGVLFAVPAAVSLTVIVLSWELMPLLGITAVGMAWLFAQVLVILVATAPWLPPGLRTGVDGVRTKSLLRRVRPFAAAETGRDGWVMGERLGGGSDTVVVACGPGSGIGGRC
jgi:Na+-driven multidrug efflux pump